jgi:hypothetical protein
MATGYWQAPRAGRAFRVGWAGVGGMKDTRGEEGAFRRRVFYIPGYDPFHPRRYRELYRKEGAAQAALSGYGLELRPKKVKGPYGWQVETVVDGRRAVADIEALVWSDLVKTSMSTGIAGTYLQLVRTAWAYIGTGALFRLMRLRKGPVIAALYPIGMLLLQLALAVGIGLMASALAAAAMDALGRLSAVLAVDTVAPPSGTAIGRWLSLAVGMLAGAAVLATFRRHDNRFFAYYLMHDYAYSALSGGANPPELEARMAEFGRTIRAALDEDWDEVLVVGHSSGAHLGVSILADLIRQGLPDRRPALSFLSLGQVVPMVSFLPGASRLRGDLRFLSQQEALTWVDVTAPGDGCAFALCDPVAVTGVAPAGQRWPLVVSAAFTQTMKPETWKALRWRFFRLHFQYLCAFDNLPGQSWDYDYFRITAGPRTLREHFAGRGSSRSVIATPASRFTSVA